MLILTLSSHTRNHSDKVTTIISTTFRKCYEFIKSQILKSVFILLIQLCRSPFDSSHSAALRLLSCWKMNSHPCVSRALTSRFSSRTFSVFGAIHLSLSCDQYPWSPPSSQHHAASNLLYHRDAISQVMSSTIKVWLMGCCWDGRPSVGFSHLCRGLC